MEAVRKGPSRSTASHPLPVLLALHDSPTNQSSNFESNYMILYIHVPDTLYDLPPNTRHSGPFDNERETSELRQVTRKGKSLDSLHYGQEYMVSRLLRVMVSMIESVIKGKCKRKTRREVARKVAWKQVAYQL